MTPSSFRGFRSFRVMLLCCCVGLALVGCPSSDDDDDSGEGEGEGEGECDPRVCDAPGEQCCDRASGGSACVNTSISFNDCGACGDVCDGDLARTCTNGECRCGPNPSCQAGSELCCPFSGRDPECIDPLTNAEACGGCNNNCVSPQAEDQSDRCLDGGCVCGDTGEACAGTLSETCCPDDGGGSSCHNIQTEVENCGGCSLADRAEDEEGHHRGDGILDDQYRCDSTMANICRLAQCVCGIPEDIGVDPAPCLGTRQSTCCAPANPQDADLAVCADLDSDEAHCGGCNSPCGKGEHCLSGVCG